MNHFFSSVLYSDIIATGYLSRVVMDVFPQHNVSFPPSNEIWEIHDGASTLDSAQPESRRQMPALYGRGGKPCCESALKNAALMQTQTHFSEALPEFERREPKKRKYHSRRIKSGFETVILIMKMINMKFQKCFQAYKQMILTETEIQRIAKLCLK